MRFESYGEEEESYTDFCEGLYETPIINQIEPSAPCDQSGEEETNHRWQTKSMRQQHEGNGNQRDEEEPEGDDRTHIQTRRCIVNTAINPAVSPQNTLAGPD